MQPATPESAKRLDDWVGPFEEAHGSSVEIDLAQFLPPSSDPQYLKVLTEIVRVEMDRDWARGQPKAIDEYLKRFPEFQSNLNLLAEIAFEEYRLRRQAGDPATPEEYRAKFGIEVGEWSLFPIPKRARWKGGFGRQDV